MRADVALRLAWHVDAGHEVVLVTASFGAYARPLGARLGASRVVATELEVDGDGPADRAPLRPQLPGRGEGASAGRPLRRPATLDWAYGDSPDDRPMLARATHPVEVGADALLAVPA